MRIDMTAREWAELIKPVLPHVLKDKDFPQYAHVRIELGDRALYAVGGDGYTIGAERRLLPPSERHQAMPPVHVWASDAKASLALFPFSKDDNPPLRVTIDDVPAVAEITGTEATWSSLGITLQSADGQRLVMHDRRMPDRDHLARWQYLIHGVMRRPPGAILDGLSLSAPHLAKWRDAVRAGEVMRLYTGRDDTAVLVTVEQHFAGLWMPVKGIDSRPPASLPWLDELRDSGGIDLRTASGLLVSTETGETDGETDGEAAGEREDGDDRREAEHIIHHLTHPDAPDGDE